MKNKIKRMTAMFLLFAMLFAVLPFSGSAQQLEETQEIAAEAAVAETDTSTEVIALREENVKHFDMGNGVFQAVSYGHPVHELDENGQWQDIDFSLSLNQTRGVSTYSNKRAGVSFPAVYTSGRPVFSIADGKNAISMTFLEPSTAVKRGRATTSTAVVSNSQNVIRTAQEAVDATFSSSLSYKAVIPNTDFVYTVAPDGVKEEIIVNSPQDEYSYSFRLELTNLTPKIEAGGAVAFYDSTSGELCYAIPNPIMYDSAFCLSEAVRYELTGVNGSYILSVIADKDWINEKGRVFPVKIDPTIVRSSESVQDTYIDSDTPNEPRYLSPLLWIRSNRVSYIKDSSFPLVEGATLQWANLHAYYYYFDNITTGSVTVGAYQVVNNWSAATQTWNNASNHPNLGLSTTLLSYGTAYVSSGASIEAPERLIFDITSAAKSWERGGSNYGIALQYLYGPNLSVLFKSNEADGGVFKPRFVYQYSVPGITLELKYDGGYAQRYSNAAARITSQANILVDKYFEEFGLYVSVSTPIQIQSLADTCPNDGYNEVCECIDDSHCSNDSLNSDAYESTAYHHKNFYKVSSSFASVQASNITRLIYLGHEYCYIDSEWHHTSTPKQNGDNFVLGEKGLQGIFYSEKNYGCVQNLNATENDQAKEIATLVHEFGHKLGAKDHYNEQGEKSKDYLNDFYKTDKFKDDCIYGLKHTESEIIEDLTICEGCRMLITQGIGELP